MAMPFCAGVIVFRHDDVSETDQVILVTTPAGHKGFPKGKRHRGETTLQTALRELKEETGISETDIAIIPGVQIDEVKPGKATVSVRYLLARYTGPYPCKFVFDPEELTSVEWCNLLTALKMKENVLAPRRVDVLRRVQTYIGAARAL